MFQFKIFPLKLALTKKLHMSQKVININKDWGEN